MKILINAGPTRESIDPVRFITNRSSGKMGYAIAEAAARRGAEVTLISGPVTLKTPEGVERVDVVSTQDLCDAMLSRCQGVQRTYIGCICMRAYIGLPSRFTLFCV